jgi:hypothetical protein
VRNPSAVTIHGNRDAGVAELVLDVVLVASHRQTRTRARECAAVGRAGLRSRQKPSGSPYPECTQDRRGEDDRRIRRPVDRGRASTLALREEPTDRRREDNTGAIPRFKFEAARRPSLGATCAIRPSSPWQNSFLTYDAMSLGFRSMTAAQRSEESWKRQRSFDRIRFPERQPRSSGRERRWRGHVRSLRIGDDSP